MKSPDNIFDGNLIQQEILRSLPKDGRSSFAVISISDNEISKKYLALKEEAARDLSIKFIPVHFEGSASEEEIIKKIDELNGDKSVGGIMIQMPIYKNLDRDLIISKIDPTKDVDGLRYCSGLESDYIPPVVLAVCEAIKRSGADIATSEVAVLGKGFLVGGPLVRYLRESQMQPKKLTVLDKNSQDTDQVLRQADIIISAVGRAGVVQAESVKDGVVLIDAGTAELNGALVGDIDSAADQKARYYTPAPGGIGPVTIAMLMRNFFQTKSDRGSILISPMNPDDLLSVYSLSNQSSVRHSSFNQTKIELEDHKRWFNRKLADKNVVMLKAELDGEFVGQVRLELDDDTALIGVSTDERFRGRGVASNLLQEAIKVARARGWAGIKAYVKPENQASITLFEKNGWVQKGQETVCGVLANKYIYSLK